MTLILVTAACSRLTPTEWSEVPERLPVRHEIEAVAFYPQEKYQCGPAALAMALEWSGVPISPDTLTPQVYTPARKGSLQSAIIGAARRYGRIAYPIYGREALLSEVAAGHPVIVLQNLGLSWYPVWHYALVIGYDLPGGRIVLHSGTTPQKPVPLGLFRATWAGSDNWGLLILPPDKLPATAEASAYIAAVIGLEQAEQFRAAAKGYSAALKRWPDNLAAYIGLGNSRYALGELYAAEQALLEASRRFPNEGAVFNNLAQILLETNQYQAAESAARRAVELGGPMADVFRQTLEDIISSRPGHRP